METSMNVDRPICIIGGPRSGTTLLFSMLASHPKLWSLYRESEAIFSRYFNLANMDWQRGNVLDENDASEEIRLTLQREFYWRALNYQLLFPNKASPVYAHVLWDKLAWRWGLALFSLIKPEQIRLVEKTPEELLAYSISKHGFSRCLFCTADERTARMYQLA